MKMLLVILCLYSTSIFAARTQTVTSQVSYYGFENSEKTPVKIDLWWDCTGIRIFWDTSCGFGRIEAEADKDGKIVIPSFSYTIGKRNTFRLTIVAGNTREEINMRSLNELKKIASKISVYKLETSTISLALKSGANQQKWIKDTGRESEINIEASIKTPKFEKQFTNTFNRIFLRNHAEEEIKLSNSTLILHGDDYGPSLDVLYVFSLANYPLGNGEALAKMEEKITYPNQLNKNLVFKVDDLNLPAIKRELSGNWKSHSLRLSNISGSGLFNVNMNLDCRNGAITGDIKIANSNRPEWDSESQVFGTCDEEGETGLLHFQANLGSGLKEHTLKVAMIELEKSLNERRYLIKSDIGSFGADILDVDGKKIADVWLNKKL